MARSQNQFDRAVNKAQKGKHWKRQDAVAVLEQLERSGMAVADFVREHELPEKRVRWWRRQLGTVGVQETEQPQFVSFQVVETETVLQEPLTPNVHEASTLEVVLRNGRVVRVPTGFDSRTLSEVVEVLEVTSC